MGRCPCQHCITLSPPSQERGGGWMGRRGRVPCAGVCRKRAGRRRWRGGEEGGGDVRHFRRRGGEAWSQWGERGAVRGCGAVRGVRRGRCGEGDAAREMWRGGCGEGDGARATRRRGAMRAMRRGRCGEGEAARKMWRGRWGEGDTAKRGDEGDAAGTNREFDRIKVCQHDGAVVWKRRNPESPAFLFGTFSAGLLR